ncbi:ABC-type xenobiotic transporter [Malassezia sp. CBS 17886]|nr:ABC-type xenobiotic transporter [Malassezia sp. CBS 17886]
MTIASHDTTRLGGLVGATAGVAVLDGVLKFARLAGMEALAASWTAQLRLRAMDRVLAQDCTWAGAQENTPSAIAATVTKDADDARAFLSQFLAQAAVGVAMVLGTLIWALAAGWQLTLCVLALLPLLALLFGVQARWAASGEAAARTARLRVGEQLYELVAGVQAARAMGLDAALARTMRAALYACFVRHVRSAVPVALGAGLAEATTYAAEALLYGVGAAFLIRGTYTLHTFMLVLNPIIFAIAFAAHLTGTMPTVSKGVQALAALHRLVRLDPAHASDASGTLQPPLYGALAFDEVYFAHGAEPVLRGVSFAVQPGERVALVGASGSGKSTAAALVQRLYEPTSGAVRIDGHNVATLDAAFLRTHLAVVRQSADLFPLSVAENLALGAPGAPHTHVVRAAQLGGAHAFIDALPDRYDTRLGNSTSLLSGGQAQRIAIARALLRTETRLFVLDELTAALDPRTRADVARDVLMLARQMGAAVLMITHDPAVMACCDRVILLKDGRIVVGEGGAGGGDSEKSSGAWAA